MIIRKKFKFEGSHRVLNCTADRCKKSFHGHSYIVEVFLYAEAPDNGGMVCDFHLLENVKMFIDSFDHTHVLNEEEPEEVKDFFKKNNERWIQMSLNPSAENFAAMLYTMISEILKRTEFKNSEKHLLLKAVRVHETATGYAEATYEDYLKWIKKPLSIVFSAGVRKDWRICMDDFIDDFFKGEMSKEYYF